MWVQAPQNGIELKVSFGNWANNGKAILGKIRSVPFFIKLGVNEGKELSFKYWDICQLLRDGCSPKAFH
jgi:hypothetical protein